MTTTAGDIMQDNLMKGSAHMAWYWIVLIVLAALFALLQLVYWLNLDNKLIYYVVRPMLNKAYDKNARKKSL